MYDTLLYGNGLTIAINYSLKEIIKNEKNARYLFLNEFIKDYLSLPEHKYICRNFRKIFNKDTESFARIHIQNKKFLKSHVDEIASLGIEIWISKHIFEYKDKELQLIKPYLYSLYNYWFSIIYYDLLLLPDVNHKLKRISQIIQSKIIGEIYTLNFDTTLDEWINPQHIHGRFSVPFKDFREIILYFFNSRKNYEYKYMFGGNGFEKASRLNEIYKKDQSIYNLEFLFGDIAKIKLGHLLIFGVSFGRSYIMNDLFLETYPEHKNNKLVKSVDGHLILRLNILYENKCVDKITISYHTLDDLEYFENIFLNEPVNNIIEYKKTSEIFDIS